MCHKRKKKIVERTKLLKLLKKEGKKWKCAHISFFNYDQSSIDAVAKVLIWQKRLLTQEPCIPFEIFD